MEDIAINVALKQTGRQQCCANQGADDIGSPACVPVMGASHGCQSWANHGHGTFVDVYDGLTGTFVSLDPALEGAPFVFVRFWMF